MHFLPLLSLRTWRQFWLNWSNLDLFLFLLLACIHKQCEVRRAWGFRERWAHIPPRQWGLPERRQRLHKRDLIPPKVSTTSVISAEGKVSDSKYSILPPLVHSIHGNACSKKKRDPQLPQCSKLLPHLIYHWPSKVKFLRSEIIFPDNFLT